MPISWDDLTALKRSDQWTVRTAREHLSFQSTDPWLDYWTCKQTLTAGHKTLVPALIQQLREAGRPDIKVVAGGVIPPQDYDYLREAGVQGIYGPGSNVVECAADVLRLLGHNMPPVGE